jgi:hypothetical protein
VNTKYFIEAVLDINLYEKSQESISKLLAFAGVDTQSMP